METMELTLRCDNPNCTYCNRPWRDMPDDSEDMVKWADVWPDPDNAMSRTLEDQ